MTSRHVQRTSREKDCTQGSKHSLKTGYHQLWLTSAWSMRCNRFCKISETTLASSLPLQPRHAHMGSQDCRLTSNRAFAGIGGNSFRFGGPEKPNNSRHNKQSESPKPCRRTGLPLGRTRPDDVFPRKAGHLMLMAKSRSIWLGFNASYMAMAPLHSSVREPFSTTDDAP